MIKASKWQSLSGKAEVTKPLIIKGPGSQRAAGQFPEQKKSKSESGRGGFPIDKYAGVHYIIERWRFEISNGSRRKGFKRNGPIKPPPPF